MKPLALLAAFFAGLIIPTAARAAGAIPILAAENFYGDVAQQIGGNHAKVVSILANPDQDPHLFEVSPSVAREVSAARIVIYNGIGYDPWMAKLLGAIRKPGREVIVVAGLIGAKAGDNPHIWYDPATMPRLAKILAADLSRLDPAHRADFEEHLTRFRHSMDAIQAKIATLRARLAGTPVTATEPVFGYMFAALGMPVRNMRFQIAVMNGVGPSAGSVAAFESDLRAHRVKLLVYNAQASGRMAKRMKEIATASQIPVVAVTETEPRGATYQQWILSELAAIDRALTK